MASANTSTKKEGKATVKITEFEELAKVGGIDEGMNPEANVKITN